MKISQIKAVPVNIELKRSSMTKRTVASTVFVRIETDQGISGFGEGSPSSKTFPGETQESAIEVIKNKLAPALIGTEPISIPALVEKMDSIIQGNSAAKTAIDLALHDLVGKALGVPVYMILGGLYRRSLPVFELMEVAGSLESAETARLLVQEGVLNLKVKVGYDPHDDWERLRVIREAVGKKAFIKIDANQKWSVQQAISFLRKAEAERWVDCVEQPINAFDWQGIQRIRNFISLPIMADEAIICLEDAKNLLNYGGYDYFNIKISRIGGLYKAKQFSEMVGAMGFHSMAGAGFNSMLLDAAGCHLFASCSKMFFQELKAARGFWLDDQINKGLQIKDGMLTVPEKPGLGIEVDETIFQRT